MKQIPGITSRLQHNMMAPVRVISRAIVGNVLTEVASARAAAVLGSTPCSVLSRRACVAAGIYLSG